MLPKRNKTTQSVPLSAVPKHVAIIMDGNNRWAKRRLLTSGLGHRAGAEALRVVLRAARSAGVHTLTVFAFSSENWSRPEEEVGAIMKLLLGYLNNEIDKLHADGVRVRFIGRRDRLSTAVSELMQAAEQRTAGNTLSELVIAIDYGGQWDISNAARRVAEAVAAGELSAADVDQSCFNRYTALADSPSLDLLIRTGGDFRISNFLLWQSAYTEFYFCETLWPDFGEKEFRAALAEYATRQRRYGGRVEEDNNA